jgi:hypothetical protein
VSFPQGSFPAEDSVPGRSGVLILRVWREQLPGNELRARITASPDLVSWREITSGASSLEEVCDKVRRWLESFIEDTERPLDAG